MPAGKVLKRLLFPLRVAKQIALVSAFAAVCEDVGAQDKGGRELPSVTISAKANPDPVEKSYRKMIRGMELFEKQRGISPNASLRFKLLPRRRETDMNSIEIEVLGSTVDFSAPVAKDPTFTLQNQGSLQQQIHRARRAILRLIRLNFLSAARQPL